MGMDMVTKGVHNVIEFLSDDSPYMDVIGISDNFFSDINKPAAVNCIEGHGRLIEAARLGTSHAELKDGTTRAPIVRSLSCQRVMELKPSLENPDHFEMSAVIFNKYH
ncbi:hypothetical protein F2Q69_00021161 [Brassica cretica]|uniref:Uncharacterized protein n=1 Tax=Brassica cretica TaxID=69181 RepID=A0A8S9QCY4_BRACR|nr:hypothetical protein F2Q69_00021161 [Brassica cretica]